MTQVPAMQAVVNVLESEGVDTIFGVPDASFLPLYDALRNSSIRHLTVRNEVSGAHAADGYSRATGRIGVCVGATRPGGTNLVAGLYTAMTDSVPLLTITGQSPLAWLERDGLRSVDVAALVRPVVKRSYVANRADQLPWVFRDAFRLMREGRPGPVHIDLPIDVQRATITYDPDTDSRLTPARTAPNSIAIERALDLLLEAERPLLMPGGGVIGADAATELVELAELLQIPVLPTLMGWGAIPNDHPLYVGLAGMHIQTRAGNEALLDSDLVLAIGARFADRHTGDLDVYRGDRRFIHIDVDPTQIGHVFGPDLGIVSDAKLALRSLLEAAHRRPGLDREGNAWAARVPLRRVALARRDDHDDVPVKPQRVFRELNRCFGPDTVFVTAISLYELFSGQFQEVYGPRRYLICGQAGPPEWEVSACTGAKLGSPETTVVGVVGDYAFESMIEEVSVARQHDVPFVIVMLNTGHSTDHVRVMEGMGAFARRVERPGEIGAALGWAVETSERHRRPALVEVITERVDHRVANPSLMVSCIPDASLDAR